HDLNVVNARLTIDRSRLANAQVALDQAQTELFAWPNISHAVMHLRSDLVSRAQFEANLDRAHHAIMSDLADLRRDQGDLAADRGRVTQLQVRINRLAQ